MAITQIIFPLVVICLFGFITAKRNWLSREQLTGLNKFIFYFVIPTFLFEKMATTDIAGQFDIRYFLAFYLPLLVIFTIGIFANYFFHNKHKGQLGASAVYSLGACYSNTIIVGLPVLLAAIGEHVISVVLLIITFHSALLFTITNILCIRGRDKSQEDSQSTKRDFLQRLGQQTLYNPVVLSISLGIVSHFLPFQIPELVFDTLSLFGQPAIPSALFLLGTSLAYYRVRQERFFISFATMTKLVIFPFFVWLTTQYVFTLPKDVSTTLVVLSASPTGVYAYLFAKLQNVHDDTVAGTVVASTLTCVITIPLWLQFMANS